MAEADLTSVAAADAAKAEPVTALTTEGPAAAAVTANPFATPCSNVPVMEDWETDERGYIFEERLAKGEEHKSAGNEHFRRGEWQAAIKRYKRAIYHADFDAAQMFDMMDHHRDMAHATQIPCKLNYVLCILKMRDAGLSLEAYTTTAGDEEERVGVCRPDAPKPLTKGVQAASCKGHAKASSWELPHAAP